MLSIVLLVLKIIGAVVLGILGLLILVLCVILFVPLRYTANGSYYGVPKGFAKVTWLLHIVSLKAVYEEEWIFIVRLFGIQILKPGQHKKETNKKEEINETQDMAEPELVSICEVTEEPQKEAAEAAKPKGKPPEKEKPPVIPKAGFWKKVDKIKHLFHRACDKMKNIKNHLDQIKAAFKDEGNQKTVKLCWKQLKKLIRHIRPKKAVGKVRFGFDDPYTTGQVLSGLAVLYPVYRNNIRICPVFDEVVLEGELYLKGRIQAWTFLWTAFGLYRDRNFRKLLKAIR